MWWEEKIGGEWQQWWGGCKSCKSNRLMQRWCCGSVVRFATVYELFCLDWRLRWKRKLHWQSRSRSLHSVGWSIEFNVYYPLLGQVMRLDPSAGYCPSVVADILNCRNNLHNSVREKGLVTLQPKSRPTTKTQFCVFYPVGKCPWPLLNQNKYKLYKLC